MSKAEFMFHDNGPRGQAERETAAEIARALAAQDAAVHRTITASPHVHTVTVTTRLEDAGTEDERRRVDTVRFVCTAPADADCRTYPDCDCDWFRWNEAGTHDVNGHARVTGRECWMKGWFDAEGAVYAGDDCDDMRDDGVPAVDRSGSIKILPSGDEWPEWKWAEPEVTNV